MDDTISRQAAIDEIFNDKIDSKSLEIMTALGNGNEALTVNMTCDRHMQLLSKLPSAQPELTEEQAIEHLQSTGWMQRHDRILTESTWYIIRCRDCKHRYTDECPMHHVEHEGHVSYDDDGYIEYDDVVEDYTCDDGFCHKNERRTDEQTD